MLVPRQGQLYARALARQRKTLGGPLLKTLVEQRQIQQPFAGVVDDVDGERAVGAVLPLVVDDQAQFADVDGGARPAPLLDQGADVVLIGEAWHGVVRLRRQPRARDPARGIRLEDPKPPAASQGAGARADTTGCASA